MEFWSPRTLAPIWGQTAKLFWTSALRSLASKEMGLSFDLLKRPDPRAFQESQRVGLF